MTLLENQKKYIIGLRENADQNNSKYGHFSRSGGQKYILNELLIRNLISMKNKKNGSEKPSNFLNVFGYEDGTISDVTKLYEGG